MPILDRLKAFALRRRRWLITGGAIFVLYSLFGFFIAPGILKTKLEAALSDATHRKATLAKVRVNPLVPSVTLEGLAIHAKDGGPWIACERVYVNARVLPLLWHTISLKELAIVRPSVQITLDKEGKPDFADLFDTPSTPTAPEKPSKPWTFALGHFSLTEGRVPFVDRSTTPEFHSGLGPLSLSLDGFKTTPGTNGDYAFEARTDAGERLAWSGTVGATPLASSGQLSLQNLDLVKYEPYLRQALDMTLRGGKAEVEARYRFAWGPSEKVVRIEDARLSLTGLKVARPGVEAPELAFPTLEASGVHADLLANQVEVGLLSAKDGSVTVARAKDGSLNLAQLFGPPPGVKPKPKDPDAKPLDFKLDAVALQNFRLDWADDAAARPVRLSATALDLKLRDFSLDAKKPAQAELQAKLGDTGTLRLAGPVRLLAFDADLQGEGEGLDLPPFDPYLAPALDLRLNKGRLAFKGDLKLAFEGTKRDGLAYVGSGSVEDFEAADGRDQERLLMWKRLQLGGLAFHSNPLSVKLQTLAWTAPEGRLVIATDGTTNAARAIRLAEAAPPSAPAAVLTPTPLPAPGQPPMQLAIQLITIKDGRLSFIDRSLVPNAALLLDKLNGRYEKLSTDPTAVSTVDFSGLAGGLAPLSITGRAMPFRTDQDTDVTVKIGGSDLGDFDPYARKYLGRTITKGKLDVDARVAIQHRALDVAAKVKLDQFYLGDKVDSPDATHLPVKLALAVLRDRKGVIAFDLPVQGSLDEPNIRYGRIVWSAVLNLLGKVAASPFTLLGKAFGGGEDLSFVAFGPGSDQLTPEAKKKLQALATSLNERPDLQMEVEGAADPGEDAAALRRAALDAKLKDTGLIELYFKAYPKDPKSKAPNPPGAEMEQRLLAAQPADLAALAQARAKAVLAALQEDQAPRDRVFQTNATRPDKEAHQARVWFALK